MRYRLRKWSPCSKNIGHEIDKPDIQDVEEPTALFEVVCTVTFSCTVFLPLVIHWFCQMVHSNGAPIHLPHLHCLLADPQPTQASASSEHAVFYNVLNQRCSERGAYWLFLSVFYVKLLEFYNMI